MVGTAYGKTTSRLWYTMTKGIVSELYYPTVDRVQSSDTQILISNLGAGFPKFLEEKRDFSYSYEASNTGPHATLFSNYNRDGLEISFRKEVIVDPQHPVLRVRYVFSKLPADAKLHVLHKPTANGDGAADVARVGVTDRGTVLVAWDNESKNPVYQVLATNGALVSTSVGSVGVDDGWQQLNKFGTIQAESDAVGPTNIALTASVEPTSTLDIAIGFGSSIENAYTAVSSSFDRAPEGTPQTAGGNFETVSNEFNSGWTQYFTALEASAPWMAGLPSDVKRDVLWNAALIKSHEDKENPGAIIAGLSKPDIPRAQGAGDGKNNGGYHLVWARDLYKSGKAMLRLGDLETATNTLKFMMRQELPSGTMAQNTWVDARPYWVAQQMDQEAYPLILAAQLKDKGVIFDAKTEEFLNRRLAIVEKSSGYTVQERWEEESGYSPNTLAVLASAMHLWGRDAKAKEFVRVALRKSATRNGRLSPEAYFIRIAQRGLPDAGDYVSINNGGPTLREDEAIDGGFLEWYKWFDDLPGTFGAEGTQLEAIIQNTLGVYTNPANGVAVPFNGAPLFRRYNGDAYGFQGKGGPWPILTAESFLPKIVKNKEAALDSFRAVRTLWTQSQMCPEQLSVNDARNATTAMPYAATPLVWCHAQMVDDAFRAEQN